MIFFTNFPESLFKSLYIPVADFDPEDTFPILFDAFEALPGSRMAPAPSKYAVYFASATPG